MVRVFCLLLICLIAACASINQGEGAIASSMAQGWSLREFQGTRLTIIGLQKPSRFTQSVLHVYIEGDGFAWVAADQPSNDPTPHQGLGLQLAKLDTASEVLYLGRPCQYAARKSRECDDPRWWTNARYSREVIDTYHQILTQLGQAHPGLQFELIGYSGGAAIAAILAAERRDIAGLRTVAGNLDSELVNQLHGMSAMPESLNPIDFAHELQVKQLHYSGLEDKVIPRQIVTSFVLAQTHACAAIVEVNQATHWRGWLQVWPELLQQAWPNCAPLQDQIHQE